MTLPLNCLELFVSKDNKKLYFPTFPGFSIQMMNYNMFDEDKIIKSHSWLPLIKCISADKDTEGFCDRCLSISSSKFDGPFLHERILTMAKVIPCPTSIQWPNSAFTEITASIKRTFWKCVYFVFSNAGGLCSTVFKLLNEALKGLSCDYKVTDRGRGMVNHSIAFWIETLTGSRQDYFSEKFNADFYRLTFNEIKITSIIL